jgi:hypothetical protein
VINREQRLKSGRAKRSNLCPRNSLYQLNGRCIACADEVEELFRQAHPKNQKQTNMSTNTKEIHLIASMIAVPGKESELHAVLRGLIGPTRKEQGCRRYENV